jgi:uncharacterized protein (DUF952 family)
MRWMKWIGIAAAILLVIACFTTWVTVPSKNITVSGIDAFGTNFGKPGYFHFIAAAFFIVFSMAARVWAKRANLLVVAVNLAWALRNYFIITMCRGGVCPDKHVAIYAILILSFVMLAAALLPDLKIESPRK